jgi:hypothetical protein
MTLYEIHLYVHHPSLCARRLRFAVARR